MDEFAKGMYTAGKSDDSERDLVTGLLTRQAGMNQIRTYMESYKTTTCALIIFEGDNFRRISDSWGRDQRERVLAICAGEIERRFGGKGIIFRMDGDEFAVFYRDTDETQVRILLDVFISSVRRANSISGFNFPITFSIGIAMYPEMGTNPDDLNDPMELLLHARTMQELEDVMSRILQQLRMQHEETQDQLGARLDAVTRFIHANYADENLSVQMLADHFELSLPYLSREFKNSRGIGVLNYINHYRIEKAKEILTQEEGITLSETARRVGYSSSQTLIRIFKRYEGVTPGQYRSGKTGSAGEMEE